MMLLMVLFIHYVNENGMYEISVLIESFGASILAMIANITLS
jgi:hypothetical protein